MSYILSLDQGTTSSRAILFDHAGNIVSVGQKEFPQIYPQPGWVEHNPLDIWETQSSVANEALSKAGIGAGDVAGIGITNQRETTLVWDRKTGLPLYNAIVWQDRRTSKMCDQLKAKGLAGMIRKKTGLVIDAYFSGTKIQWILQNVKGAKARAKAGELAFGTVDSWLIWNLTGGKCHVTDVSNASRTMLLNLKTGDWDNDLLELFGIPRRCYPKCVRRVKSMGRRPISRPAFPLPALPAISRRHCLARSARSRAW
ncbi:MAG: FGGY family carbohydrate kinase [Gemmatales bacterium]